MARSILRKIACKRAVTAVREVLHLPLIKRLVHRRTRRIVVVMVAGAVLMTFGSAIAAHRNEIAEVVPVHHLIFDVIGYFIHACGALPALKYIEPFVTLLLGSE